MSDTTTNTNEIVYIGHTRESQKPCRVFRPETIEVIYDSVRAGQTMNNCAYSAGVSPNTLRKWLDDGKRQLDHWQELDLTPEEEESGQYPLPPLGVFYKTYHMSKAGFAREVLDQLMKSAKSSPMAWAAAMTALERSDPDQWAQKQQVSVQQDNNVTITWKRVDGDDWLNKAVAALPDPDVIEAEFVGG